MGKAATARKPEPQKRQREKKTPLQRVFSSLGLAMRAQAKAVREMKAWDDKIGADSPSELALAITKAQGGDFVMARDCVADLEKYGFAPPARAPRPAKVELEEGGQVFLREKVLDEMRQAFGDALNDEALNDMHAERIVGKQVLVRIGEEGSRRYIGFVAKGKLQTTRPANYPEA